MSEMIERVAIKVFLSHGYPEDDWLKIAGGARDEFRRCARATIEAMREPTEAMNDAGLSNNYGRYATEAWRNMIDTALKDDEAISYSVTGPMDDLADILARALK